MITASDDLKDIFYNSTSVNMNTGCTIEYNMNSMLDNITVTTTATDSDYIAQVNNNSNDVIRLNPFKKLFPVDSIVKPFRPLDSGIKYYIVNSPDISSNSFSNPKSLTYPSNQARVYYPGVTTTYKY